MGAGGQGAPLTPLHFLLSGAAGGSAGTPGRTTMHTRPSCSIVWPPATSAPPPRAPRNGTQPRRHPQAGQQACSRAALRGLLLPRGRGWLGGPRESGRGKSAFAWSSWLRRAGGRRSNYGTPAPRAVWCGPGALAGRPSGTTHDVKCCQSELASRCWPWPVRCWQALAPDSPNPPAPWRPRCQAPSVAQPSPARLPCPGPGLPALHRPSKKPPHAPAPRSL